MAGRPAGPVTLMDVAREAGVSLATASRALNGSTRRVRDDLRERVVLAATRLNYTANAPAQAMARGRTNVVGLLVQDIADPYFSSIAAGVMRAAEAHGLLVTIVNTLRSPQRELEYLTALRSQRANAAIVAGSRVDEPALLEQLDAAVTAFQDSGGRVALISQPKLAVDTVVLENRGGARDLAERLVDLGYRRFGILAGSPALLTSKDRLTGFREGLKRRGVELPPGHVFHQAFTRDGGYDAMLELLDAGIDVDCVFAVNDVMAVGAMAALRSRKKRLPRDVAVAGFDDIPTLRDVTPSLTTVHLPLEEVGAMALELVVQPPADRSRIRRVKGEVIVRESTPQRG